MEYSIIKGSVFPEHTSKLPIDTASIIGQRFTDPKVVDKHLERKGGYDRGSVKAVFAIAVPMEKAKKWISQQDNPQTFNSSINHGIEKYKQYALFIIDGDHTRALIKRVNLGIDTFPHALIYFVNEVTEGNKKFNEFNKYLLTKVSAESELINNYLGGDPDAIDQVNKLDEAGIVVCDKKDSFVLPKKYTNDKEIPSISANPWQLLTSDWHPEFANVKKAIGIIKEAISISKTNSLRIEKAYTKGIDPARVEINSWWIHGLAKLLEHRPALLKKPKPAEALPKVFAELYDHVKGNQHKMLNAMRQYAVTTGAEGSPDKSSEGANNAPIWAVIIAMALNEHGEKHGVAIGTWRDATKLKDLFSDIYSKINEKKKLKAA